MRQAILRFLTITKKWVLWIPVLTFIVGTGFSVSVYNSLRHRLIEAKRVEASQRSYDIINKLDLSFSNSILRVQSYEEYLGSQTNGYNKENKFFAQLLKYTIFERFSIYQKVPGGTAIKPKLKMLSRVDVHDVTLPPANGAVAQEVTEGIATLVDNREFSRSVIYDFSGVTRLSFILQSRTRSGLFLIFSTPLTKIFEKTSLKEGESIDVTDIDSLNNWTVKVDNGHRVVQRTVLGPDNKGVSHYRYSFVNGLPQSGLKVNFRFNFLEEDALVTPALMTGLACLLVTILLSYLFWVLVRQNRLVSRLVVEKTHDLEKTHQQLQEALLGKSRFLGNISHEIRTPLNLILGMIDLCEERDSNKKITEYLQSMRSSGNHLLSMIEDLLDLAKSETNDLQIQPLRVNLSQFLSEISRISGQDCAKKNLRFYTDIASDVPAVVISDPSRLRQILLNLLRNACKYTNVGHVLLKVSVLENANGKATLRFEVQDTGVGIPQDKIAKVFEAFFQVETSFALSEGGVGLGLAIVRELVRKLDGKINISSTPKKGSTFQVDLSMEVPESLSWLDSYRIADNADRELVIISNDSMILETVSVLSGRPHLKVIAYPEIMPFKISTQKNFHKDRTIFVDATVRDFSFEQKRDLTNYGTVVLIGDKRALYEKKQNIVVPILDSSAIVATDLLLMMGYLPRTAGGRNDKKAAAADAAKAVSEIHNDISLIIADDDAGNIELYKAYLEGKPWNVAYANNGQEAYDLQMKQPADVLILDLRMPVMDGFEVAEKLRNYEMEHGLPATPILLVTADALEETVARASKIAGVSFLTKPIRKSVLFDSIGKNLEV